MVISPLFFIFSRPKRARVLYILSTSFYLPPSAFKTLQTSIELYLSAISLSTDVYLVADARFNLARAILDLVEMAEDGDSEESILGSQGASGWRTRAWELLLQVETVQESYLSNSENVVVEDAMQAEEQKQTGEGDAGEASDDEAWERQMPTFASLVETLLLMIEVRTDFWLAADQTSAEEPALVASLLDKARAASARVDNPEQRTECEVRCKLGEIASWRNFRSSDKIEVEAGGYIQQLKAATTAELEIDLRNQVTIAIMDLHADLARSVPDQAWQQLSQAITTGTSYITASNSNSTPSIQVGGAVLTPQALFTATLYSSLSILSLRRGLLADQGVEAAARNLKALLVNAEAYANKALHSLGWSTFASDNTVPRALPAPAGWDAEAVGKTAVFNLARGLFYLSTTIGTVVPEEVVQAAKAKLAKLGQRIATSERSFNSVDVRRYVEDVETDEGSMREPEKAFWQTLLTS